MNTSNGMRVLLAAGDATPGATLARGLLHENVDVVIERSAASAKERALREHFDVLVVDGDLPAGGGDLCRSLRRMGAGIPTIMLIEPGSMADRLRARTAEADAYLVKPVALRALLSELHARKVARPTDAVERVNVADLTVDTRARWVTRGGRRIDLTRKEFALLEILAGQPGALVDRATIAAHVWGNSTHAAGNVLEVLVRRLRRKIDDGHELKLIETMRGKGYRLINSPPQGASTAASADLPAHP